MNKNEKVFIWVVFSRRLKHQELTIIYIDSGKAGYAVQRGHVELFMPGWFPEKRYGINVFAAIANRVLPGIPRHDIQMEKIKENGFGKFSGAEHRAAQTGSAPCEQ